MTKPSGMIVSRSVASCSLGFLLCLLTADCASTWAQVPAPQSWDAEYRELADQIARRDKVPPARRTRLETEALDVQALIQPADRDPLDVVLRRTDALIQFHLKSNRSSSAPWADFQKEWARLHEQATKSQLESDRVRLFHQACALRRRVAFANPLFDFDRIVCMLEQPGDLRVVEQARAVCRGHSIGGGPIVLEHVKDGPVISTPVLEGVPITSGAWQGHELKGKFSGLELDEDANNLYFAATTDAEVWHLFRFDLASRRLEQLTDGPDDDFDPYPLPSGRIVFTSTRRGGIGRCVLTKQSLTYTLHSIAADGSDPVCLSFHETNEWQPCVSHDGKIVYTRWDYVDRHWGTAHHYWECFPDGRDPRSYHGNYPLPWSAMPEGVQPEDYGKRELINGRVLRPDVEMSFRPVPGTSQYTATAVGHHEGFSGSLVLIDPRIPDDGKMAQVKRITPEYPFPEVEPNGIHAYGTAWPLSSDFYLGNFMTGLYLIDRFGNRDVIYDPGPGAFRVRDPFPMRARPRPPVLPVLTWQGERANLPDHHRAVLSVMNVYTSDAVGKLPEGTKVRSMRIVQVVPQMLIDTCCSLETVSLTSFATDSIGRLPLGVVPVEEDGSVYCEAPVGKAIYFQLLDEKGMAVQSMRSATYVHPGENLTCVGCHEDKWEAIKAPTRLPMALRRPPSPIVPEVDSGIMPFNYVQLVKEPVFDQKCVACHREHPGAPDMSYKSLARNSLAFSYPGEPGLALVGVGGSRTTPGHFGAMASGIMKSLKTREYHRGIELTDDQRRRLTLWLDLNSNELGWIGDDHAKIAAQRRGVALWPPLDVDHRNPMGVERDVSLGAMR